MAREAKEKTRKLTILLLKDSVKSCEAGLQDPENLSLVKLKNDAGFTGEFWHAMPRSRTPAWISFIDDALEHCPKDIKGTTVAAVLFVRAAARLFAITFGYGRNLLKPACYELGFGLKVALNTIDHKQLRSMDIRTYEEFAMSTRKQASRSADLTPFGLDISRDMLRAITGEPTDQGFAKRVTGADAVTINLPIRARDLEDKCRQLLAKSQESTYKTNFAWIDNLQEVRDQGLLDKLNDRLIEAIRNKQTERLHLAAPEPLDWQNVDCFQITGTRRHEYNDLDIDDYLSQLANDDVTALTIEKIKSYRVSLRHSESGQFQDKWSLFSCIVWETETDGSLHVLVEGKWFQVETSFAQTVKQFVRNVPVFGTLPAARPEEKEGDYNGRVAEAHVSDYFCLDGELFKPLDAATEIEFCDLLGRRNRFVHVKRKSRSSTLSHLFSQGTVGARVFLGDGSVRNNLRAKLTATWQSVIPDDSTRPTPGEWEVVYAVITKSGTEADALPFFSQLNLMQHTKLLQELGFKVAFAPVSESAGTASKPKNKKGTGATGLSASEAKSRKGKP
ncbi:MAG: DUF6119 family protein [Bacillota bacterium]